jgi:TPR repeat protein
MTKEQCKCNSVLALMLLAVCSLCYLLQSVISQKEQQSALILGVNQAAQYETLFAAAKLGDAQAQYQLGVYFLGESYSELNRRKATIWLKTSAQAGVKAAQVVLNMMQSPKFLV